MSTSSWLAGSTTVPMPNASHCRCFLARRFAVTRALATPPACWARCSARDFEFCGQGHSAKRFQSMKGPVTMATLFILVGAEGFSEMNLHSDRPSEIEGVRLATAEEEAAFRQGLEILCKGQPGVTVSDYYVDGTGRPYWLVAVLENAAEAVRHRAKQYKRVLRLL